MAHLGPAYSKFFRDLAKNNNRDWFKSNKKRYEEEVKVPFYELVADLITRVQKEDPAVNLEVKNAVFRIYRDTRFSKDKTPYKLHMSAVVSRGGRKDMLDPGIYVHVEANKLMIAGGCYNPDKANLEKIRKSIIKQPKEFEKLHTGKTFRKYFPDGITGDRNKILPKGIKEHAEAIPILFQKQFFYYAEYTGKDAAGRKDIAPFIMKHYKAQVKMMEFLREALGK